MRFSLSLPEREQSLLNALITRVEQRFEDTVDLIAVYGSRVTGGAHHLSDLDVFFVPTNTGDTEPMLAFIHQGIGHDFWPINWHQLIAMSEFEDARVAILADAQLVYSRHPNCTHRFQDLKRRLDCILTQPDNGHLRWRLHAVMNDINGLLYQLIQLDALMAIKPLALDVFDECLRVVCYWNQRYCRGGSHWLVDLARCAEVPPALKEHYLRVFDSGNADDIIRVTVAAFRQLQHWLQDHQAEPQGVEPASGLCGAYEEMLSVFNKLSYAVSIEDAVAAFYAAKQIDRDLSEIFGAFCRDQSIPVLTAHTNSLPQLASMAEQIQRQLLQWLQSHNVPLCRIAEPSELLDL